MNTLATKITYLRILLVPFFMIFVYIGLNWLSLVIFLIACISDALDGYIARKYNQISDFGKFLDPLADKMIVIAALCYFVDRNMFYGWILAVVVIREFAVSGLRLIAAEKKIVIAARISGKIKTAATMVCISAMLVFPEVTLISLISQYLILAVTLVSGIDIFVSHFFVLK